jgi:hypothetical protein
MGVGLNRRAVDHSKGLVDGGTYAIDGRGAAREHRPSAADERR